MAKTINKEYWDEYYKFWDEFVAYWFWQRGNRLQEPQDKELLTFKEYKDVAQAYKHIVTSEQYDFNEDELPEPYQGDPESGIDAVVLNLNPGMSQKGRYGAYKGIDLEATKFYANIDIADEYAPNGWLLKRFRDEAGCIYREFVSKWSCLNPTLREHEPEVCGVHWWQDPQKGRMKWVRQIYGNNQLCPSRVFAPEICPFHSKTFPTNRFDQLKDFIKKHVIDPAAMAVIENGLPFAVAVGRSYANVLTALGAQCKEEWTYKSSIQGWPKTGFWKRTYRLYSLKIMGATEAYFIVTWAISYGHGLPAPEQEFSVVEGRIYEFVKKRCGN